MIDSFVQVGQAMRTCADTVQAFADASALANPTDIGSLLSILAAGHSLATNISGSAPSAGGLEQSFEEDAKDKKKRKRALKDPNAPKRPVTAYLQFQNEVKNEVQDQHRDKSYKDILRLVAEKWKGLDDGIKNVSSSLSRPPLSITHKSDLRLTCCRWSHSSTLSDTSETCSSTSSESRPTRLPYVPPFLRPSPQPFLSWTNPSALALNPLTLV